MAYTQVIFNELCVRPGLSRSTSEAETAEILKRFAELLRDISKHFNIHVFRVRPDFKDYLPDRQHPFSSLLGADNKLIDPEVRQLIKARIDNSRYLEDLSMITDQADTLHYGERSHLFEFSNGEVTYPAIGLGIAYLLGELAISLHTEPCWDQDRISVQQLSESAQNADTTGITTVIVAHASASVHLNLPKRIFEKIPKHDPDSGWGSPMDLSEPEAQTILEFGVTWDGDKKVYGCDPSTQNLYVFHPHREDHYHGFREDENKSSVPEQAKRKLKKKGLLKR